MQYHGHAHSVSFLESMGGIERVAFSHNGSCLANHRSWVYCQHNKGIYTKVHTTGVATAGAASGKYT